MEDTLITLEIMIRSLERKKVLLEELKTYTKKQSELLMNDKLDYPLFNNIIENKQARIDELATIDAGFVPTYERIANVVKTNKHLYKDEIKTLKALIRDISDMQVDITMAEGRNKKMFTEKISQMQSGARTFRTHNDAYKKYQGAEKSGSGDFNMFDSKK